MDFHEGMKKSARLNLIRPQFTQLLVGGGSLSS